MSQYVIKHVGFAGGSASEFDGQYIKSFDVDAHDGQGFAIFTRDPREAIRFPNAYEAMKFWQRQSTVRPLRADGKPNRPMTASTIELYKLEDV